jgi:hypothetical protein
MRVANNYRCYACLHPFAFEPTTDSFKMADGLFHRAIQDVSAQGTLSFTDKQLYYELNRRLLSKVPYLPPAYGWGAAAVGVGGIAAGIVFTPVLIVVGIAGAMLTAGLGINQGKKMPRARYARMPFDTFLRSYLSRYEIVHGAIEKLVRPLAPRPTGATGTMGNIATLPPDVTAYSFDRVLITQDAETAAMLVANRFHFENNCAILSFDRRYPQNGLFDTILGMLRRNPQLMVFVLHDASAPGLTLYGKMRTSEWFPDNPIYLFDLGLRPLHAMKGNFILTQEPPMEITKQSIEDFTKKTPTEAQSMLNSLTNPLSPEALAALSTEEQKWLKSGHIAEVACLRPERVMKAVYQGFNQAAEQVRNGQYHDDSYGGIWFVDTGPGVYYAPTGTYTGDTSSYDSFG